MQSICEETPALSCRAFSTQPTQDSRMASLLKNSARLSHLFMQTAALAACAQNPCRVVQWNAEKPAKLTVIGRCHCASLRKVTTYRICGERFFALAIARSWGRVLYGPLFGTRRLKKAVGVLLVRARTAPSSVGGGSVDGALSTIGPIGSRGWNRFTMLPSLLLSRLKPVAKPQPNVSPKSTRSGNRELSPFFSSAGFNTRTGGQESSSTSEHVIIAGTGQHRRGSRRTRCIPPSSCVPSQRRQED